ncbi:MAG: hypothetical protein DCC49_09270 [Acidobacteria bacterium]|nr:MAG: hypothetical protein DCC49_09270 [Acidobacteriota bacterium]
MSRRARQDEKGGRVSLVREAVHAVPGLGQGIWGSPLVASDAVTLRLLREGVVTTEDLATRVEYLARIFQELAWERLSAGRVPYDQLNFALENDVLSEALSSSNQEPPRREWACLYAIYLTAFVARKEVGEVAERLSVDPKTTWNYRENCFKQLAQLLDLEERKARKSIGRGEGAMRLTRVMGEGHGSYRVSREPDGRGDLWTRLRQHILSSGTVGGLGEQELDQLTYGPVQSLENYQLSRFAAWAHPRYRLDQRFVNMALMLDERGDSMYGQWRAVNDPPATLDDAFARPGGQVIVLVGASGAGKSTLLRHYELGTAARGLREEAPLTYYVRLRDYRDDQGGAEKADPEEWLSRRWAAAYPDLPPLEDLLDRGDVVLLLDGLNEIGYGTADEYERQRERWRQYLTTFDETGRSRVAISCRRAEDADAISTATLRVAQVRIGRLDDEAVLGILLAYRPMTGRAIWEEANRQGLSELLRTPYFARLYIDQSDKFGHPIRGRAALFTGLVRKLARREVERGNPNVLGSAGTSPSDRHPPAEQLDDPAVYASDWELPDLGTLFPDLVTLAFEMRRHGFSIPRSRMRDRLGEDRARRVLEAGRDLGVLEWDRKGDEVAFAHPLVQEYFAGRELARVPQPELARQAWRLGEALPDLDEALGALSPADPLPLLLEPRWAETMRFASAMSSQADDFVVGLAEQNLVLAAECLMQAEVRGRVSAATLQAVTGRLAARSRDIGGDPRERIHAGIVLGRLGDPRLERRLGPHGPCLLPPFIPIPAGWYTLGSNETIRALDQPEDRSHCPRHKVWIEEFEIAQFLVTRAEWALFIKADAYRDPGARWWDTEPGRRWQAGTGTADGSRYNRRYWHRLFQTTPGLLDQMYAEGGLEEEAYGNWQEWVQLPAEEFEVVLEEQFPEKKQYLPRLWGDPVFAEPSFPVAGLTWYEARAYCNWLSEQTGDKYRLPTEPEWEAAARGLDGRDYPWGETWRAWAGNTPATHVRRPSPVGVFPAGDTPEGIADLIGNVLEWTSSAIGDADDPERYGYPYDENDGREVADAGGDVLRVQRGSNWAQPGAVWPAWQRAYSHPANPSMLNGLRLVREKTISAQASS